MPVDAYIATINRQMSSNQQIKNAEQWLTQHCVLIYIPNACLVALTYDRLTGTLLPPAKVSS